MMLIRERLSSKRLICLPLKRRWLSWLQKKEAVVRRDIAKGDALKMFGDRGETYKCELISELEDGHITTYTQGDFTDLCRGPHLMTTAPIKAIKLDFCGRSLLAWP